MVSPHYKSMGKYWIPSHSKNMHPLSVVLSELCPYWLFMMTQVQVLSSDLAKGHLRSPEITKCFLLISFDWEDIQTCEWARCVCHTTAHRMICNMTCVGQVGSCALDLRLNFEVDLSMSCYTYFNAPWQDKHDGIKISFQPFPYQKLFSKNYFRKIPSFWPWWSLESWPLTSPQI